MSLLELDPVHNAFRTVLSTFMDLVRDRSLTRKGGKGEDIYVFCKSVDQICATGEIIRTKINLLARGNSQGIQQLHESLFDQARKIRSALESLQNESGPFRHLLDEDDLDAVAEALGLEVLKAPDVDSLKKLLLKTEPGERTIRAPEDIAERLTSLAAQGRSPNELSQLTNAVKKRVGKDRDPGDGRVMTVKPRKGG